MGHKVNHKFHRLKKRAKKDFNQHSTVVIPRNVIFTSQRKKSYVALTLIPGFNQNHQCQTVMTKQTHSPSHKMKIY